MSGAVYPVSVRKAMSGWPTGVAILTTADREGWWWGCAVNSVASVSEVPPIVAVSIPKEAAGRETFTMADAVAIHVLREGQEALADHFTNAPTDFDTIQTGLGVTVDCGFESVPLLTDVATRLECRPVYSMQTGGNVLLLAEVVRARTGTGDPLVHVGDHYRHLTRPA